MGYKIRRIVVFLICIFGVISVTSCEHMIDTFENDIESNFANETKEKIPEVSTVLEDETVVFETEESQVYGLIEEGEFYKLFLENNQYYCVFYDKSGDVVKKEGPLPKRPRITTLDNSCLKVTVQAGTGLSTLWGYYYNVDDKKFSEHFDWILAESNGLVACASADKVIVRDIFDGNGYYKEITDFKYGLSVAIEPIIGCKFIENNSVEVTYLSGENYEEKSEIIALMG